jgi:CRP-like cAMP-binding protein
MESHDLLALLDTAAGGAAVEKAYKKGEALFRRGDRPQSMFFILSGEARLVRCAPTGMEVVFQRTARGVLAEASLDQAVYHCDAVAALGTRALVIPLARFRAALAQPQVREAWLRHLSSELRRVRAQAERLALRTARHRVLHFIETEGRAGRLVLSQSKKSWAAELGLTHEALYRALAAMERCGIIEMSGTCLQIRPAPARP